MLDAERRQTIDNIIEIAERKVRGKTPSHYVITLPFCTLNIDMIEGNDKIRIAQNFIDFDFQSDETLLSIMHFRDGVRKRYAGDHTGPKKVLFEATLGPNSGGLTMGPFPLWFVADMDFKVKDRLFDHDYSDPTIFTSGAHWLVESKPKEEDRKRYDAFLKYAERELSENRPDVLSFCFCTVYGKLGPYSEIIVAQNFADFNFVTSKTLQERLMQDQDYGAIRKTFYGTPDELIEVAYEGIPLPDEKGYAGDPVRDERLPHVLRNIAPTEWDKFRFEQFLLYIERKTENRVRTVAEIYGGVLNTFLREEVIRIKEMEDWLKPI